MKKVFLTLVLVDFFLGGTLYLWKGDVWFINSQIAFISSSLVMLASMLSYKGMVEGRLEVGAIPDDERDTLEKLEDPYEVYDEKLKTSDEEKTLVEVVKEERASLKKGRRSLWETTKDAKASLSFYRFGAYIILVMGFFYLNSNTILELIPYLVFLGLPPILSVFALSKIEHQQG